MAEKDEEEKQPIIIKKIKKGGGGHHGGAWKVAYADFVTAMMAFFLLMWLLNVTTAEEKELISAYFSPADPRVSESVSGSGGVMGGTTMSPDGAMTSDNVPVVGQPGPPSSSTTDTAGDESGGAGGESDSDPEPTEEEITEDALAEALAAQEAEQFKAAEEELKQAIESVPELQEMAENLLVDQTPEGLRIQIVDQKGKPMFALGSAQMYDKTRTLLELVNKVIVKLPNRISVRGHTDSFQYAPGATYTNWELSADRANASRRVLLDSGLSEERIENTMGKADREHLVPEDPKSPRNRRISIILLKQSIVPGIDQEKKPAAAKPKTVKELAPAKKVDPDIPARPKRPKHPGREEGIIYFP